MFWYDALVRWLVIALIAAAACGNDHGLSPPALVTPPDASDVMDVRVPIPAPDPNFVDIVTPEGIVQPGESKIFCYYFDNPGGDVATDYILALEGLGAHHIALMTSSDPRPAGTFEDCTSAEANAPLRWFILPTSTLDGGMPAGTAMWVPADKPMLVQFHIVNSTDYALLVRDAIRIHKVDPTSIATWAATIAIGNLAVNIPADGPGELSWACTLPEDRKIVEMFGHMHDIGTKFAVDIGPSAAQLARLYTVDTWEATDRDTPPIASFYDAPIDVPAGTVVRTTCDWLNPAPTPVIFPEEMCITFAYLTGSQTPEQCQ